MIHAINGIDYVILEFVLIRNSKNPKDKLLKIRELGCVFHSLLMTRETFFTKAILHFRYLVPTNKMLEFDRI